MGLTKELGSPYIDTGHLLLGLIARSTFSSYTVLSHLGIEIEQIQKSVLKLIEDEQVLKFDVSQPRGDDGHGRGAPSKLEMIEKFADDLTAKAAAGTLDPVVGRAEEIEETLAILGRR